MTNQFDEDYFIRGIETGKSNYENYRWMPERTIPFAHELYRTLGMCVLDSFLDFGCARGYTVRALRELGFRNAKGYDTSEWAIANCDPAVMGLVSDKLPDHFDFCLAKDVFEHIPISELVDVTGKLMSKLHKTMLVIVPLANESSCGSYVRDEDNKDKTHLNCWTLTEWMDFFWRRFSNDFEIEGSWHINGLKPTSLSHPKSCGFITLSRIAQR